MTDFYRGTFDRVCEDFYIYNGAVRCGVIRRGDAALLVDCCDSLTPQQLMQIGVRRVEMILLTQYTRPHTAGAKYYAEQGAEVICSREERMLIEHPESYWQNEKNRWMLIDYRPYHMTPVEGIPVSRAVTQGEKICWRDLVISVLQTPGATDGAVSYLLPIEGKTYAFCGELMCAGGQVPELYSLQVKDQVSCGYHGFLGARYDILRSARVLADAGVDRVIPSHGPVIEDIRGEIDLLDVHIRELMDNYSGVSAMNFYFPELFPVHEGEQRLRASRLQDMPDYVLPCGIICFLLKSKTGAAIMLDCFRPENVEVAQRYIDQGVITSIDKLVVTHYHYDHIEGVPTAVGRFGSEVVATEPLADVLNHPRAYFMPCVVNVPMRVHAVPSGTSIQWNEFKLTLLHYPGQTLYGDALLVEKDGQRLLFVGDSLSPTGLDDYCPGNRNFLREGTGMLDCLDWVERLNPVLLVNQHQEHAFSYDQQQIDFLREALRHRRTLVKALARQRHEEYALDEWWVRAYPFESHAHPGDCVTISLSVTNHTEEPMTVRAQSASEVFSSPIQEAVVPPLTSGLESGENADGHLKFTLSVPKDIPAGRYVIPFRVQVDGVYLGQFRCAQICVD